MRARLSVVVAAVFAALLVLGAASPAGALIEVEDFEDGSTAGWSGNGSVEAVTSPTNPNGGDYVGKVTFSSSCWGPSYHSFTQVAADYVSWYFRSDGDTGHPSGVSFGVMGSSATDNTPLAQISYHNGELRAYAGGYRVLQAASTATWYHIELKNIDWQAGTYDIWVNGVRQAAGTPFMNSGLVQIYSVYAYACPGVSPSGSTFVDDITVTTAPSSKDACKKDGWQDFTDPTGTTFKNQGDCVSYVATNGTNAAAG